MPAEDQRNNANNSKDVQLNIINYRYDDLMDETDFSTLPTPATPTTMELASNKRPTRVFCCGDPLNVKSLLSRPGGAVQVVANSVATALVNRRIDSPDEVGGSSSSTSTASVERTAKRAAITANGTSFSSNASTAKEPTTCTISTIELTPSPPVANALVADRGRVQFLSDNHLDELGGDRTPMATVATRASSCSGEDDEEDEVSAESMPSTSDRTQDDLIQFVFTSHGIRVISDKEYVV